MSRDVHAIVTATKESGAMRRDGLPPRGNSIMRTLFWQVPLLGIVAVAYLITAALAESSITKTVFSLPMPSGHVWSLLVSDIFLVFGLILLYMEIVKSTRTTRGAILDHALSMLVMIGCILLFLLVAKAGSSTFFLITMMTVIDVISGFSVGLIAARRDIGVERGEA